MWCVLGRVEQSLGLEYMLPGKVEYESVWIVIFMKCM